LLFVLLSTIVIAPDPLKLKNPPMEVDLIAEAAPVSTAPEISEAPPPPRLGDESDAPDDVLPPEPLPPVKAPPAPVPAPVRKLPEATRPVPVKKAPPKLIPPKAAPKGAAPKSPVKSPPKTGSPRPTGRLDGITSGLGKEPVKAPAAKGAPAAQVAAEVKKSIDVSIKAKIAPRWNACKISGVDIDQLKTVVRFKLSESGALIGFTGVTTSGQNDSNRFQVQRHQDCAKKAVELAAPFDLPVENYSFWQNYTLDFIKR
ncbi:MAG: hypothetical protein RLZZ58_839, partial [Pseudomonadota bacterium]